jgi:lysophospholipase L1-like esterase
MTDRPARHARIRIVAMGDSTTAGTPGWRSPIEAPPDGAGDDTSQYAYWLVQAHPEWEVLNRGVNGERSDQIKDRFARDVLIAKPAAVVLIAGVNDVYQGRPASHVIAQLSGMYEDAIHAAITVVAGSIIPYNTATPAQNERMHEINAWIRDRSDGIRLHYVDSRGAVAMPGNIDLLGDTRDQLHPTAAGYRLMANAIAPALEHALAQRANSTV